MTYLTNNPLYGPPAGIDEFERFNIGAALISRLVQELRSIADFKVSVGKDSRFSTEEIAAAVERETERCQRIYDLVCKYVPEPLEWEFYEYWLDAPTVTR